MASAPGVHPKKLWSLRPQTDREAGDAVVQNFLLHWFPAKVSKRSLDWSYSFWLGTISAALFLLLILSGLDAGVRGVRVGRGTTERLWLTKSVSMYLSSPVLVGDLVFGFSHLNKGQLFCLDPRTGETVWTGEPRQGDNASLVVSGEYLLALTNEAQLTVSRVTPQGIDPVRRYTVADSATWAHPLVLPSGVVVKDAASLARLRL